MDIYKQKYEQALSQAEKELKCCGSLDCDAARQIFRLFPELKESEDERIRKQLLNWFKDCNWDAIDNETLKRDDIIAWLEKQGEQGEIDYDEELKRCKANPIYFFDKYVKVKLKEQKPAWSEEDEKYTHGLIRGLTAKRDIYKQITFSSDNLDITETINWLNSLKNRIWFQQKYDNDEDLNNIADRFMPEPVWNALEESEGEGSNAAAYDYSQMIDMFKAGVHWLKSLKERMKGE